MIRYALRCTDDHRFEAWFASSSDYERLKAAGHVACAVCGGAEVEKDLMAPAVASGGAGSGGAGSGGTGSGGTGQAPGPAAARAVPDLSAPASPAEAALRAMRQAFEAKVENVGRDFAQEARRIHAGEAPGRPIWGEARPAEAKALVDDGIPVAPLPWSGRKTN